MTLQRDRPGPAPVDDVPSAPPARVRGVDLARGIAVLGMFGAHMGIGADAALDTDPASWWAVVDGRSSILFAVLAGVSIALLSGGSRPVQGEELVRARVRVLVRAAWVFLIGGLLELLDTFVAVILGVYAVLFVLAVPFLRWSPARLLLLAGVLAVVTPVVDVLAGQLVTEHRDTDQAFAQLVVTGFYPALVWWTFVLVGLAVGRLDLRAAGTRAALVGAGTTAAVVGYAGGWLSARRWPPEHPEAGIEAGYRHPGELEMAWFSGAAPHGGTPFEVVGSTGVALAVLGLCLVLADRLPRLTGPLASVGALALSVYSGHLVAIAVLDPGFPAGIGLWLSFCACALVAASPWRLAIGRGPLERLLARSSRRAAGVSGPARSSGAAP